MAHGGEGIARDDDGRVVFVAGAIPGDTVDARVTKAKKRWARAALDKVVVASGDRIDPACPAAAAGAGCCDYAHIAPAAQLGYKREVLLGQLGSLARSSGVLAGLGEQGPDAALECDSLSPSAGWRTRVRLGVDERGRAGLRRAGSAEIVADRACTQPVTGLLDGIVGAGARRFSPGSEVIAVRDALGARHVVVAAAPQRGRRVERTEAVVEGDGLVTERVGSRAFRFPATAFWQAHVAAAQAYSDIVAEWGAGNYSRSVGWDLYGGVGAFAPAIDAALGGASRIETVDYSASAAQVRQDGLAGLNVAVHNTTVEKAAGLLPPGLVVLDPPRSGAGAEVVKKVAAAGPERVIHVGCDPATFSRDLGYWGENGYRVTRMKLIDAFPNTHHFEVVAALEPSGAASMTPGR